MRARLQKRFGVICHWLRARMGAPIGDCVVHGKWRSIVICDQPCVEVGRRPGATVVPWRANIPHFSRNFAGMDLQNESCAIFYAQVYLFYC